MTLSPILPWIAPALVLIGLYAAYRTNEALKGYYVLAPDDMEYWLTIMSVAFGAAAICAVLL